jgi:hypothetical protein
MEQRVPEPLVCILETAKRQIRKSPAFRMIAADGPTSVSEEMTLPQSPQDLKQW